MLTELEHYIHAYFPLSKEELVEITKYFHPVQLEKGEYFVKRDRYCDKLGFVRSGYMREHFELGDKEVTKWISSKGYFTVDLSAFLFRQPARWNIQAITDCELFVIDYSDYKNIAHVVPKWQELEKLFIAKCFAVMEERIVQHLAMTAEQRYQLWFETNKPLFQDVPLQYIASMLGMTPETFSRIRKKTLEKSS
ncbi:MAG TPA: Crp/Fnr family transcriptional regulator [Flavobacteriales bacterium]